MSAPRQKTLLHIAERQHWEPARDAGAPYTMSTLGMTLEEVGFVHCSSDLSQVEGVLANFYTGIERDELVLLVIDAASVGSPIRYEPVDGQVFPHVYGPIPTSAVIDVRPLPETR